MSEPATLVPQRDDDDCTLCCISMATGIPYERVLEVASVTKRGYRAWEGGRGTMSALCVLAALGIDGMKSWMFPEGQEIAGVWPLLWARRAILAVPSLNGFKGWHDVYWDGEHLFDPSPKQTYPDTLEGVRLLGVTLFKERP